MFSQSADLYDVIYGSFKDYRAEATRVAALLREVAPDARTVLDAGCGTAEHARLLRSEHGYEVDGLDIDPAFVVIARSKVPDATFWEADMADFALAARFDAIVCLFSSIGYLTTLDRVERALRCFRTHLAPAGIAVVEPWFGPEAWVPGRVYVQSSDVEETRVVRMSHSTVEGRVSRLAFHYLIGTEGGIEHRIERHELGLFTAEELREAFRRAGFASVEHDPEGLTGRGLYLARAR
jgi:SAM-dependent methyltransferase